MLRISAADGMRDTQLIFAANKLCFKLEIVGNYKFYYYVEQFILWQYCLKRADLWFVLKAHPGEAFDTAARRENLFFFSLLVLRELSLRRALSIHVPGGMDLSA